ncbi:MAG: tetratricopeptide repeat protein [Dongiaceae bacterium]
MNAPAPALHRAVELHQAGRLAEAEVLYRGVLAERPDEPDALHLMGVLCHQAGRPDEAVELLDRAVAAKPRNPDFHADFGKVLYALRRFPAAAAAFQRAVDCDPGNADAWAGLGEARRDQGEWDGAAAAFRQTLAIKPGDAAAQANLGMALVKAARFDEHVTQLEAALAGACPSEKAVSALFLQAFLNPLVGIEQESALAAAAGAKLSRGPAPKRAPPTGGQPPPARLRVGYLSSYYSRKNYLGFLDSIRKLHDTSKFDVRIYASDRCIGPDDGVRDVSALGNDELCRKIRKDGIHILVDTDTYGAPGRLGLLARKPAPIVVSWFNAFSSTGIAAVDYLFADSFVAPPEEDRFYPERIYRLPGCYVLWDKPKQAPEMHAPPMLFRGRCTFGSLASDIKINAETVRVWSEILKAVPDSTILIRNEDINEHNSQSYRRAFERHGVDPGRVELLGGVPHHDFLETYRRIDIVLDTFPRNGGTTTAEALWQGAAVVTLQGARWVSRVGATILNAVGRPEWVAETVDGYVRLAASLARHPERLRDWRRAQREDMAGSIFCDAERFTRNLEAAYAAIAREKEILP